MEEVIIDYTNWRGERRERKIVPKYIAFGSSKHHPGQQWLLVAKDTEKGEDRTFAMDGIHSWRGLLPSNAGIHRAAEGRPVE